MRSLILVALLLAPLAEADAQCSRDLDCASPNICIRGHCRPPMCTTDRDCMTGQICQSNRCIQGGEVEPAPRPRWRRTRPLREHPDQPGEWVEERQSIRGLWIGGISVFAASYFAGILVSSAIDDSGDSTATLAIPLAGPWILVGDADEGFETLLILDGLMQLTGVAMTIVGFTVKRTVRRRVYSDADLDGPVLTIAPTTFGGTGLGASLTLTRF